MNKLIEEKDVFDCGRFKVIKRKFTRECGTDFERFSVNPGNSVVILPITNNGELVFIEQMRESVGKICLELPAGVIDQGELPINAAKRELEEETGFIAEELELLLDGYPSAGYTSERMHIFLAKKLKQGKVHLDDTEEIENIRKISIEETLNLLDNKEIEEINVVVAILMYLRKYGSK